MTVLWYDYIPKIHLTPDGMILDAVFVVVESLKILLTYLAIRKYTDEPWYLAGVYAVSWDFFLIGIRDFVWILLVDWVGFQWTTMTPSHIRGAYIIPFIGWALMLYVLRKFRKYIAVGKITKFTLLIVALNFVVMILLQFADFREPSTCILITPNQALIYHIISKSIWIPLSFSLLRDGCYKMVERM